MKKALHLAMDVLFQIPLLFAIDAAAIGLPIDVPLS